MSGSTQNNNTVKMLSGGQAAIAPSCPERSGESVEPNPDHSGSASTPLRSELLLPTSIQDQRSMPTSDDGVSGTRSTQQRSSTTSFILFPKLPLELRKMIWSFAAIATPQVIERQYNRYESLCFTASPGALMSTCQDSRRAALEFYKLMTAAPSLSPFYFSPDNNFLLLDEIRFTPSHQRQPSFSTEAWKKFAESVTVLAVDPFIGHHSATASRMTWAYMDFMDSGKASDLAYEAGIFPNLREIILFYRAGFEHHVLGMATQLGAETGVWDFIVDRSSRIVARPWASGEVVLRHRPKITCLPYAADRSGHVMPDMKKALLAYVAEN